MNADLAGFDQNRTTRTAFNKICPEKRAAERSSSLSMARFSLLEDEGPSRGISFNPPNTYEREGARPLFERWLEISIPRRTGLFARKQPMVTSPERVTGKTQVMVVMRLHRQTASDTAQNYHCNGQRTAVHILLVCPVATANETVANIAGA